jgi:hypothetical protein
MRNKRSLSSSDMEPIGSNLTYVNAKKTDPKTISLKHPTRLLFSLTLVTLLFCVIAGSEADSKNVIPQIPQKEALSPRVALEAILFKQPAIASAALETPTNPGTYYCDYDLGSASGMEQISFEFTRQLPQNGWLAKMHSKHADGKVVDQDVQLFAPKEVPTGTEWSFQTQDGKNQCKMVTLKGRHEVRFGGCTNKLEEYCLAEPILDYAKEKVDGCAKCKDLPLWDRPACYASCLPHNISDKAEQFDCSKHWFHCIASRFMTWLAERQNPDLKTLLGLEEMYWNWVRFVEGSQGLRGENGSGSCIGYGYLCPGGTTCLGDHCGLAFKH